MTRARLLLLFAAWLAAVPFAQAEQVGRLEGRVKDESGNSLPGVTVDVHAVVGDLDRPATTDVHGRFVADNLPAGRYQVDFRLPSFATSVRTVEVAAERRRERRGDPARRAHRGRAGDRPANLPQPDRPGRARERPARPGRGGLRRRRHRGADRAAACRSDRARSSRRCPGSWSASTAARARRTSTTSAASTSTTAPTWRRGSRARPINMPTHAHGQGYSDNNFLIPELVSGVQYQKGTYSAEEGDFSAAGAINVNYLNVLDHRSRRSRAARTVSAARCSQRRRASAAATSCMPARRTTATAPGCAATTSGS